MSWTPWYGMCTAIPLSASFFTVAVMVPGVTSSEDARSPVRAPSSEWAREVILQIAFRVSRSDFVRSASIFSRTDPSFLEDQKSRVQFWDLRWNPGGVLAPVGAVVSLG